MLSCSRMITRRASAGNRLSCEAPYATADTGEALSPRDIDGVEMDVADGGGRAQPWWMPPGKSQPSPLLRWDSAGVEGIDIIADTPDVAYARQVKGRYPR